MEKELKKWAVAPKEIEEEVREMLQRRHRLGYTCVRVFVVVLAGILWLKLESLLLNVLGFLGILGGIAMLWKFYDDEKYLKERDTKEKVRVKTVLLHEVVKIHRGIGVYSHVSRYLRISYPMGEETVIRDIRYSDLHLDIGIFGLDFVGFYGKKITIAYCNGDFYILNHVYPEYDDEMEPEEKKELLKNPETTVRNLIESIDEEQILKAKLQEELTEQTNYKMAKYCSRMVNIVGVVVWCILRIVGIKGKVFVILWGGIIDLLLIFRFGTWHSCKKHSGEIWDRKKIQKISEGLMNPETTVRKLIESIDEEQVMEADLQVDLKTKLMKQTKYKMAKYCSRMVNIVGAVVWCILCIVGIKGKVFVILWGGIIVLFLIFRFGTWYSCKKHSGEIWDRKKIRKISEEIAKKNGRN